MRRTVVCLLLAAACALAQTPWATSIRPALDDRELAIDRGAAALWQSLKKLGTRASLIMITAHPDDEDAGMLTYDSRGAGARVHLLTLNRGEGGANVMSADFFDALGLVRTMEMLAAGRWYGVEQHWTRVVDYGFSKTKAESISRWTHDRVLADVVRVIRTVRPQVITSVFVGGPSDGHGNHETAGAMAQEAFHAAADPKAFPELRPSVGSPECLRPRPRRRLACPRSRRATTTRCSAPPTPNSPAKATASTNRQNGGPTVPRPGAAVTNYRRFASRVTASDNESSFFDGIDTSVPPEIAAHVEQAVAAFSADPPRAMRPRPRRRPEGDSATAPNRDRPRPPARARNQARRSSITPSRSRSDFPSPLRPKASASPSPARNLDVRVAAVSQAPVS